jgi:hypothetical protein
LTVRDFFFIIDYNENLYQTPRALEQLAQLCNEKKMNAKTCSERSAELYLAVLIRVSLISFVFLRTVFSDPYHNYQSLSLKWEIMLDKATTDSYKRIIDEMSK